jgi:RHS repeat-associated protein
MTLMVNSQNQVTAPAFTYDAAGNVTWDTTHTLSYDAEGRMTPVSGETYTYDADGHRVLKSDGTVYWMDDQLRPLSVGTTSGSITRDYIFLGSQRIAMVPLSSGNPYYYLSDRLGSTAVIASGDGKTIQWEADYFPFGSVQQIFTNLVGNYEFTGYENDSETGYNYANARFQSGRWGHFLSPDPYLGSIDLANPQSLNRHSYVLNNATNMIDPLGLLGDCAPGTHAVNPGWGVPGYCENDPIDPTSSGGVGPTTGGGHAGGGRNKQKPRTAECQKAIDKLEELQNQERNQPNVFTRDYFIGLGVGAAVGCAKGALLTVEFGPGAGGGCLLGAGEGLLEGGVVALFVGTGNLIWNLAVLDRQIKTGKAAAQAACKE